jgi:hypothetical protein
MYLCYEEVWMSCPKCKAKIGMTKQEVVLDSGVAQFFNLNIKFNNADASR